MFFSSFRQFKPIAVPRPVVLQQFQTLRIHTNDWAVACSVVYAACNNGCDLHFRRDRCRDACSLLATRTWRRRLISRACTRPFLACVALSIFLARHRDACNTAVKILYSTVATAQLAVHTKTESSGFAGNLIRQRRSRCRILSQNVQLSTNDRAFARRVSNVTCTT